MPWRKYKPRDGKYGHIYHVAKGVQVRRDRRGIWTLFLERAGQRKNKTFGSGREALAKALKAAEKIASKLDSPGFSQPIDSSKAKTPLFRDYSKNWLEECAGGWVDTTYERYEGILRLHILPDSNFKKGLDEISRRDIKKHLRRLLKTHSPATVELAHTVLCSIFEEACEDEILKANPARGLLKRILPRKRDRNLKEADPFDLEERDRFLARAERRCVWAEQLILKVMAHCGFRLGEALAIRARYLDLRKMTYCVSESYRQYRYRKPKGGEKRFVDIPAFLAEELKDYLVYLKKASLRGGSGGEVDLLFRDPDENDPWPYSQRKVQRLVERVCKGAGLRVRNPHDLRHTYATIMLMAHQSPAYVQKQLGHSSIAITVDLYGHWIPGEGRRGLEDALLGGDENRAKIAYNRISTKKRSRK
jgi:integrase